MDELITTCQALSIDTAELTKAFTIWRFETLHVRGVDQLTSEDIYNYFGPIHPHSVEWLSNISCNVTFDSSAQACNALQAVASALIIHKNENPDSDSMASIPNLELEVRSSDSLEIPVPPNYRYVLGNGHEKAKSIIIRFATLNDKKITSTGGPVKPEAVITTPSPAPAWNGSKANGSTNNHFRSGRGSSNQMEVDGDGGGGDHDQEEEKAHIHRSFNSHRMKTENPTLRMRMHADEEEQLARENRNHRAQTRRRPLSERLGDQGPRIFRPGRGDPDREARSVHHRVGYANSNIGLSHHQPASVVKSKHHIWRRTVDSNGRFDGERGTGGKDLRERLAASRNAMVRVRVSYDEW